MGTCYRFGIVRVIARSTLKRFIEQTRGRRAHAALKSALEAWFTEARKAHWKNAADVKRLYATASIVSSDRVVFNIKGNDYRLVVAIDYEKGIVWIKWIGTHAEYDGIDVRTVSYEESKASPN
jgi:mRNA interferase HigB